MIVDFSSGRYVAHITFEERFAFKGAGWWWDANQKKWMTAEHHKAAPFKQHMTEAARSALDATDRFLALSYAEDADVAVPAPPGLFYDPFQKAGILYASLKPDCLIADPMGLGKTIQAIGLSNYTSSIKSVLVVCPASLTVNWRNEWHKWDTKGLTVGLASSKTRVTRIKGEDGKTIQKDDGKPLTKSTTEYYWPDTDVVIISYDMLKTFKTHIRTKSWDLLVCDESQYLCHQGSERTRLIFGAGKYTKTQRVKAADGTITLEKKTKEAVSPIVAGRRLFLSGTPILSRPSDLWTVCEAFDPTDLGKNWLGFARKYCGAIKAYGHLDTTGASNLDQLQLKLRSAFMVRRSKASVLKDLPSKRRQLIELPSEGLKKLVDRELSAATQIRNALRDFEKQMSGQPEDEIDWTNLADMIQRRFGDYSDLEYMERAKFLTPPEKIAFEEYATARRELAAAKVPMIVEHLEDMLATGQKIVCFCVHTELADALLEHFPDAAFITGKVPPTKRQAQVERFQNDPECRLLIGNIVAAGTGFTMTASSITVFPELDWIASRIVQAEDRVWRRGQKNACLSQHLVVEGTSDARLVEIFLQKLGIEEKALDMATLPTNTLEQKMILERQEDAQFVKDR